VPRRQRFDITLPDLLELANHGPGDIPRRHFAGQVIGVGVEVALEVRALEPEGGDEIGVVRDGEEGLRLGQARFLEPQRDLAGADALGQGDGIGLDVARGEGVEDLWGGLTGGEFVLAHLQPALDTLVTRRQHARPGAPNEPLALEPTRHRTQRLPPLDDEEARIGGFAGSVGHGFEEPTAIVEARRTQQKARCHEGAQHEENAPQHLTLVSARIVRGRAGGG